MNIIDTINAPAAHKPDFNKPYLIDGLTFAMVEDTINKSGELRPQAIIASGEERVYAPSNVSRAVKDNLDKGLTIDDIESELKGHTMVVKEVYSQKWRRMIAMAEIS